MKNYLLRHLQVLVYSFGEMTRKPFPTLMTVTVLGIALALPSVLYVLVDNLGRVGESWHGRPQISLFLQHEIDSEAALAFGQDLLERPAIDDVAYTSPDHALKDFQQTAGFGAALELLEENPLPPLVVVYPHREQTPEQLQQLFAGLQELPQVDRARFDREWVERLSAITTLLKRVVAILAMLLALGVGLVIANTVRLSILNRRDEIEITDQIGGTHAFIRRPFLYMASLQGALGALAALVLTALVLFFLSAPVSRLAQLYGSDFSLQGLGCRLSLVLIAAGVLLGWLAARITVGRHLASLEPE